MPVKNALKFGLTNRATQKIKTRAINKKIRNTIMKLTKLAIVAAAATLVVGVSSARAGEGVTTNYSILNFKTTIVTNGTSSSKGNLTIYPVGKVKAGNKQLLDLFANWAGTTWPTGAKLVVGWDAPWDGDVLVVDKTRTNVLFDASSDVSSYAYFYVDFNDEDGAYKEQYLDADPGYNNWTESYGADFELYDDDFNLYYTEIYCYGGNTQTFKQAWDASGNGTKWSDKEKAMFNYCYDHEFVFNTSMSATTKITASGHGIGYNPYWY